MLSGLHYAKQQPAKGYQYFNAYELLSDSILNESISRNTIQIEKRYASERLSSQVDMQKAALNQKTILNNILAGGILALMIIMFLIFRNYKGRQQLQQVKIDELEKEKQLMATEAVLKGEAQERTRLAKDLHDGLGGMLSGIKYSLSNMKENLVMTPDNTQAFERSLDMLNSSISEMRRVAHNMMPEMLVRYGLNTALKTFCQEIDQSKVVQMNYQSIDMEDTAIDQTVAVTVYRIVQELVNNAMKHAGAKNIFVQAHASLPEKILTLTVEDDGHGFDPNILQQSSGMGWTNIQSRVEFLKGRIDLNSAPGEGTSVLIEINNFG